jgi:hypothetical protein
VNRVLRERKTEDKLCIRDGCKKVAWKSLEHYDIVYHIGAGVPLSLDIQGMRRFVGFVSCLSVCLIFEAHSLVTAIVSVFSYVVVA